MARMHDPDTLLAVQRDWHRTYAALAARPRDATRLRRRLLRLSTALMWHPASGGEVGRGPRRVELCRAARPRAGHGVSAGPPGAVEVRPWRRGEEPEPRLHIYPYSETRALSIRVQGRWRHAEVCSREDRAGGRVIYNVEIYLTVGGVLGCYARSYLWDPAIMHPPPPVRGVIHR